VPSVLKNGVNVQISSFTENRTIRRVKFSPDGAQLAACSQSSGKFRKKKNRKIGPENYEKLAKFLLEKYQKFCLKITKILARKFPKFLRPKKYTEFFSNSQKKNEFSGNVFVIIILVIKFWNSNNIS